ncbi:hypothetical protein [Nitrobacter sp. Nb-311A]|uniref:hypothetical protein n=1 Tax=Nitrobacter sp. Nb-311A TaxID=314253 RepID=UPI0002E44B41|nr:hypothetical protein [Nitrobacter sp. Nb-311A]
MRRIILATLAAVAITTASVAPSEAHWRGHRGWGPGSGIGLGLAAGALAFAAAASSPYYYGPGYYGAPYGYYGPRPVYYGPRYYRPYYRPYFRPYGYW